MKAGKVRRNVWHIIIGGTIGNLTEWYNFLLYGYLAAVISPLFFPAQDELTSLTLAFSVFALSFFARPLGGILFGWIGDTYGRQRALLISLIMMGVPTLLIGLLPTYASIGVLSPVLLCLLRMCQGLSAGGEHTGSAVYVAEYAPPGKRTLWVSTVPASAAFGLLFSSLMALLIIHSFTAEALQAWGWRVGYWAGAALCLVSILLRVTLPETPLFTELQAHQKVRTPIKDLLHDADTLKSLLIVIGLACSWGIFYQILFIWMPTYLTRVLHFDHDAALQLNSIYVFCLACLMVAAGYLADYLPRKNMLMASCAAMLVLSYPLFLLLSAGALWQVYLAMGIFTLIFCVFLPTSFVTMVEAFHTSVRYTGLSLGFNIGLAVFGGTCPLVATWLIEISGDVLSPAYYMMFAAVVGLIAASYTRCTRSALSS